MLATRTRQKVCLIFRCIGGQDSTTHWILPFNKIWNGSARTGKRPSQQRLHPLLRHGHKTRHGGIVNTGKILNSGESGEKNGKTTSVGRNGKRRQQTIHVHPSIRKLLADEYCFNCCPSCFELSFFFAILHNHQPCSFFDVFRVQTLANAMNATGGVQITPHRTHACAHFSCCVPHFAQFIQCTCIRQDVAAILCVSPKSSHPRTMSLLGVPEFSAFPPVLLSSTTPPTPLTGIRLNPCATPLWVWTVWPSG